MKNVVSFAHVQVENVRILAYKSVMTKLINEVVHISVTV